jgi:outer membrane lipoprotein-sorting protein
MSRLTLSVMLLLTCLVAQAADLQAADGPAPAGTQPAAGGALPAEDPVVAQPTATPAAQSATKPAAEPAATQSVAATQPAAVDPAVEKLLDEMEAAGKKFHTLSARLEYTEVEVLFGDRTTFLGKIYYEKDPAGKAPARFRIHFDKVKHGQRQLETSADRDVAFFPDGKGQWLITRDAGPKQWSKYQVARPGESADPLKLGQGPFPVPFGQEKAQVLKSFDAKVLPPRHDDPKDTTCLELIPNQKVRPTLKVRKIEIWVDADGLPQRIRTEDDEGNVVKTATFTAGEKNEKIDPKVFDIPEPTEKGWEIHIEQLPARSGAGR